MKQKLTWRIALIAGVMLLATIYLLPNFSVIKDSPLGKFLPESQINLGLDLKGGIYLTLGVDVDKAVENSMMQNGQSVRSLFRTEGVSITNPRLMTDKKSLEFTLPDKANKEKAEKLLAEHFPFLQVSSSSVTDDGMIRYILAVRPEEALRMYNDVLDQALTTISNRIDQFGVAEPDIRRQTGENRIIVQLPGIKDADRAIDIIGKTAHLEFHIVNTGVTQADIAAGRIPPDTMVLPSTDRRDATGAEHKVAVYRETLMTGEHIKNAKQDYDRNNQPAVAMSFSPQGTALFGRITTENVNKSMAIVLDGKVYSAPNINEPITQGTASITGRFTLEEARDLALVLRAGSLPAPVTVLEERTVGPTLGQESIEKGIKAAALGGLMVVIFMVVYYSASGIIASIMLILDMALLLAGMGALGATLTLPGIAGIVLTLGMAVDANVLIYERIREELGHGLKPHTAIDLGFSRATMAILDSNLTTVIAAIILYQFGTGPIRGFAVTLTLGILVSMFTAIFVSRVIFMLWKDKNSAGLSI